VVLERDLDNLALLANFSNSNGTQGKIADGIVDSIGNGVDRSR